MSATAKPVHELTLSDFQRHPIWSWWDEDTDLVEPVDPTGWREAHNAIFVLSTFTLNDGTSLPGEIAIRSGDVSVYLLHIWSADEKFVTLCLQSELRKLCGREAFAAALGKPASSMYPLTYRTAVPIDGQIIEGVVP